MAKEFVKGVTVGEATAEENTQPAVSTVETNEEETKQVIRENEEDFIAGLIAAADFASDEEETQRVEIVRNGKLAFAFSIRPLGSEEYDKIEKSECDLKKIIGRIRGARPWHPLLKLLQKEAG